MPEAEPDLQLLVKIAAALDVTPNHLIGVEPSAPIRKVVESGRSRSCNATAPPRHDGRRVPAAGLLLVEAVLEHGRRD